MIPLYVYPEQVEEAWPEVEQRIQAALETSNEMYRPEDIKHACQEGSMQLWMVADEGLLKAVVVTTILSYPQKKAANILICTGEGREGWQDMMAILEEWARRNDCQVFRPFARPGWERILKPMGYTKTHVVLEKVL